MRFLRHFKNKVYNNLFKLEKILHRIVLLIDDLLTPSGFKRITKSAFRKLKKKIKDLIGAFFYKIGDFLYTRVEATIEWIKLYFVQTKHLLLAPIFFWKEKYKINKLFPDSRDSIKENSLDSTKLLFKTSNKSQAYCLELRAFF